MSKTEKLIPKRRFGVFINDNEWKKNFLHEISEVYDGTHQTPNYTKTGIMFLSVENIKTLHSEKFISKEAYEKDFKIKPERNDILMTRIGDIGTANIIKYDIPIAYYVSLALIKAKLNAYFLKANITSPYIQAELWKRTLHIAFPKKINKSEIENVLVKYPDRKEQIQIGEFFKKLDILIQTQQKKLEKTKTLKSAYLAEIFPCDGELKPKLRFANFKELWQETKVKDIFIITRGKVLALSEISVNKTYLYRYPVYSSQTTNDGLMGYYKEFLFEDAITWTTDGANAGTVNYRQDKFYSTNVNGVLLSNKGFANKTIAELLNKIAWKYVSKVGNPKLMNVAMAKISILIPAIEEQTKIGNFFKLLDKKIALEQRKLEKLNNIKQAYLNEMFV